MTTQDPIFKADEIKVIRDYLRLAIRLRPDLEDIKKSQVFSTLREEFRFDSSVNSAINEEQFNLMINNIIEHTEEWPEIEKGVMELCQEIFTFSDTFSEQSAAVIERIKSMPEYDNASKRLAALPEGEWEGISIPLGVSDQEMIPSLKTTINTMANEIGQVSVAGGNIKTAILDFKKELMNNILPGLRRIASSDTLYALEEELERLELNQDDLTTVRGHMQNVTTAFSAAVSASYLRERRVPNMDILKYHLDNYNQILDTLSAEKRADLEDIILRASSSALLSQHVAAFQDIAKIMEKPLESADKGVGQLRTFWTVTVQDVKGAQQKIQNINSFSKLKRIEFFLNSSTERWREVRNNAELLENVLKSADV
ncbi:hypothetical protein [Pseudomonas mucidolens]|uniref:Uncharacterized protein n=1 Tax=Pseudomonas mucidolens TaxID=46679 RepID=A0A1H2P1V2_9PSED|nr:hypothetical protein [Pseudomonas mucidolens]SDV11677.1 hypothetical protein SAMN05216202_5324 [Pseudomonas mucidolens]SQH36539.1 Uncharacterised protein [Pseudomonas mucidolens]